MHSDQIERIVLTKSTCVVMSTEHRTSDLDIAGSRPPATTRHIHVSVRYVLFINSYSL